MENYGFFNGIPNAQGKLDRSYNAVEYAKYFSLFIGDGVFQNPLDQLLVKYTGGEGKQFTLVVKKGWAFIEGYWYHNDEDLEIEVSPNTSNYGIYNSICVTLDKNERKITITNRTNVGEGYPRKNEFYHDLVLCRYYVGANSSHLNVADLEDKRPDGRFCGYVSGVINQINAGEIFLQMQTLFNDWFDKMKGQLTEDAAGKLQTQIDSMPVIRSGKTDPPDSLGKNGDIYIKIMS